MQRLGCRNHDLVVPWLQHWWFKEVVQ